MEGARKFLAHKINELQTPSDFLHQFLHILSKIWVFLVKKFNQVLPPETLNHFLHIFLTIILPITLVLLCLYRCCCGEIKICACIRRCFSCFCCCCSKRESEDDDDGGGYYEPHDFMRAPGRNGEIMPRNLFENDPRGYFRDLRDKKDLPKYYI